MAKLKGLDQLGDLLNKLDPDFVPEEIIEEDEIIPPSKQKLHIQYERKGRKGKEVCLVKDFQGTEEQLKELAKALKSYCGVGGAVKDGEIIIQGDKRKELHKYLTGKGYKVSKT
jgi:translation initiation factor 1